MIISSIRLQNFRSFTDTGTVPLRAINVFTGPNNSGKSSVLLALYQFQNGYGGTFADVRVGASAATIAIDVPDPSRVPWLKVHGIAATATSVSLTLNSQNRLSGSTSCIANNQINGQVSLNLAENSAPHHFVRPYLSKRKTSTYSEDIRRGYSTVVAPDFTYLSAKLSTISNPGHPNYELYRQKCLEIIGFFVTAVPSENGQQAGVYFPDGQTLYIQSMGEGIPHIVSLLADLITEKDRIFLIEEPENDLHPKALKALLDLVISSAERNQFLISTHSNTVVRYLALGDESKLFSITSEFAKLPTEATISEVPRTVEARLEVLRDLGYSFSDFDLWDGWLILEEASAEIIIRNYLIPLYAPKLSRIRTLSAQGADNVEPAFDDFNRLVRFTHLEEAYRNAAWVIVDGDEKGKFIINKLANSYKSWDSSRFSCFTEESFEKYYPSEFSERIATTLAIQDKQQKRREKKRLLDDVKAWLDENQERAYEQLSKSAGEVIEKLLHIEKTLFSKTQ